MNKLNFKLFLNKLKRLIYGCVAKVKLLSIRIIAALFPCFFFKIASLAISFAKTRKNHRELSL